MAGGQGSSESLGRAGRVRGVRRPVRESAAAGAQSRSCVQGLAWDWDREAEPGGREVGGEARAGPHPPLAPQRPKPNTAGARSPPPPPPPPQPWPARKGLLALGGSSAWTGDKVKAKSRLLPGRAAGPRGAPPGKR